MNPKILPAAVSDLERGREFYDSREPGIGDYFVQRAFADIESLRLYGGIHPRRYNFHWFMVSRFPWAIYYEMESNLPVVYRILDCRSHPDAHRQALEFGGEQHD